MHRTVDAESHAEWQHNADKNGEGLLVHLYYLHLSAI